MKTALLVSGQVRGKWKLNLKNMIEHLKPDAVYTSTWLPSDEDVDFKFPEPVMKYHPVVDTKPYPTFKAHEYRERCRVNKSLNGTTQHRTKQILQHNMLMEQLFEISFLINFPPFFKNNSKNFSKIFFGLLACLA